MNMLQRLIVTSGICLLLPGCLLTTDVDELMKRFESKQLEIAEAQLREAELRSVDRTLPKADGRRIGADSRLQRDIGDIVEKTRAVIEMNLDKPNLVSPLYVRLGVLHITAGNYVSAEEAFQDAAKAGGELSSTLMAYRDLGGYLTWWYAVQPNKWTVENGDFVRAAEMISAIKAWIDRRPIDGTRRGDRDTLMWLHNVRMRVASSLTNRFQTESIGSKPIDKLMAQVMDDYLDFWEANGETRLDAMHLARVFGQGVRCQKPSDVNDPAIGTLLKDVRNIRWSLQVVCNVSGLMTWYHQNVAAVLNVPDLNVSGRDWIRCDLNAGREEYLCRPTFH